MLNLLRGFDADDSRSANDTYRLSSVVKPLVRRINRSEDAIYRCRRFGLKLPTNSRPYWRGFGAYFRYITSSHFRFSFLFYLFNSGNNPR